MKTLVVGLALLVAVVGAEDLKEATERIRALSEERVASCEENWFTTRVDHYSWVRTKNACICME